MAKRDQPLPDVNYRRGEKELPDVNFDRERQLPDVNYEAEQRSGRKWYFWALVGLGVLVGVFLIALIVAILIALLANPEDAANWLGLIRDVFIIVLALEGMLMGVALIVLVIQLAALVNLLQNEITPIVDNASETVTTVRGTAQFMSQNLVQPTVRLLAVTTTVGALVRELFGVRRAARRKKD